MKSNLKGVIMTAVTFLATLITNGGLPKSSTEWIILIVTMAGTVLAYLAKNIIFPSVSLWGSINLKDLLSGVIMAVSTALSNWAGTLITNTSINWNSLLTMVLTVVIGYLAKTFMQGEKQS